MNTSNFTDSYTDPMVPYYDYVSDVTFQCGWISSVSTVVHLTLLFLIASREINCDTAHKMKYLSPINVQIALMSIANTLITDIFILQLLIPPASSQVYTGLQMATDLSYYLFPFLVIYYTYCRAFPIIKSVANWSLFIFRGVIVVFGLLVLAQLTVAWLLDIVSESSELAPTAIIAYNLSNSIGTVIGEVLMTAFEVSSLALFIAYLRQSRRDGFTVNTARLTIVARFGIASFWCFQSYLASSIIINYILLAPEPQVSLSAFQFLINLKQYSPLLYVFIQLLMRWCVHAARESDKSTPSDAFLRKAISNSGQRASATVS